MNRLSHPRWSPPVVVLMALLVAGCVVEQSPPAREAEREVTVDSLYDFLEGDFGSGAREGPPLDFKYWVDRKRTRETTVRQALIDLKARRKDGKVIDPEGRVLYFWRPEDHHIRSPRDETEREQFNTWLEQMKRDYRMIPMYIGRYPKH